MYQQKLNSDQAMISLGNHGLACKTVYELKNQGIPAEKIREILINNGYAPRTGKLEADSINTMASKWRHGYFLEDGSPTEKNKKMSARANKKWREKNSRKKGSKSSNNVSNSKKLKAAEDIITAPLDDSTKLTFLELLMSK